MHVLTSEMHLDAHFSYHYCSSSNTAWVLCLYNVMFLTCTSISRFSEIPKQKYPAGAIPSQITLYNMDLSYTLTTMLKSSYNSSKPACICSLTPMIHITNEQVPVGKICDYWLRHTVRVQSLSSLVVHTLCLHFMMPISMHANTYSLHIPFLVLLVSSVGLYCYRF